MSSWSVASQDPGFQSNATLESKCKKRTYERAKLTWLPNTGGRRNCRRENPVRRNHAVQSDCFRPRVLLAFAPCLVGGLVAMVGFAVTPAPTSAATPTLSPT